MAAKKKKNDRIEVGGVSIDPGQRVSLTLPVADLYTSTSLGMPVHVVCGKRKGPVLFVSAAVHGDELNGVEIVRRLLKLKLLRSIRGTLIAVPIVNVHGFLDQSRYLPDRRDLNRSFPGSPKGSIAARMAHRFSTEIVAKADYGLDLHTGALNRANLPQIRANIDNKETLEFAKAFGAPVVIDANVRDGSLRGYAAELGMPMLIYEAGEALRFDEMGIRAGLRGTLDVMRHIGMLSPLRKPRSTNSVLARSTSWVRSPASGIVTNKARLGDRVATGDRLATLSDPLGDEAVDIDAPFDGIVIGRTNLPLAHEGDALFHVASFKSVPKAEDAVETFAQEYTDEPASGLGNEHQQEDQA